MRSSADGRKTSKSGADPGAARRSAPYRRRTSSGRAAARRISTFCARDSPHGRTASSSARATRGARRHARRDRRRRRAGAADPGPSGRLRGRPRGTERPRAHDRRPPRRRSRRRALPPDRRPPLGASSPQCRRSSTSRSPTAPHDQRPGLRVHRVATLQTTRHDGLPRHHPAPDDRPAERRRRRPRPRRGARPAPDPAHRRRPRPADPQRARARAAARAQGRRPAGAAQQPPRRRPRGRLRLAGPPARRRDGRLEGPRPPPRLRARSRPRRPPPGRRLRPRCASRIARSSTRRCWSPCGSRRSSHVRSRTQPLAASTSVA